MRILITIPGISDVSNQFYLKDAIEQNVTFNRFLQSKYHKVIHFQYQDILDKHAIVAKTLLDPLRFSLAKKLQDEILCRFTSVIKFLQNEGYEVDLLTHSLGCWISAKLKIHVNRVIHLGSPVGWKFPVGRFYVRSNIAITAWTKPPLTCDKFFNIYSSNDVVGNKPVIPANKKWAYGSTLNFELNSQTSHDADKYIDFLKDKRFVVW